MKFTLPDKLTESVNNSQKSLEDNHILQRIFEKDFTVWDSKPDEISNRLDWLDSPNEMVKHLERIDEFVTSLRADGYNHAYLLGMGGSSLAPDVYKKIFGIRDGFLYLEIIDTTDPDTIFEISKRIIPQKTLFILSTKSGGTIETLSLFKYFYNLMSDSLNSNSVGKHFIAITDPGSKLEDIAKSHKFREIFLNNPNIGGRYSALSYFGLVPAALVGINITKLLSRVETKSSDYKNDGIILGAIMGEAALHGINKLTFFFSSEIKSFGDWLEQLIAESTGKSGKGILPIVGEIPNHDWDSIGKDRLFVLITLGEDDLISQFYDNLKNQNYPCICIDINDNYDIGRLIFMWEIATSIAGRILKIHPFNQPNVESSKKLASGMIKSLQSGEDIFLDKINDFSLNSLLEFINKNKTKNYFAIHAYLPPSTEINLSLNKLQEALRNKYQRAVTWGYGPRFLHSTGQLHKGDQGQGLFIQLISFPQNDIPIPIEAGKKETSYTFGMLKLAQAFGDSKALKNAGRQVISFKVPEPFSDVISGIAENLKIS